MVIAVTRSNVKNLCAWTLSSNAVQRTIKVHIVLMTGSDVMEGPIVRMVKTKSIVRRERVRRKNSNVIMEDAYLKCGCGKFFVLFF